jgi:hypothetical protein
MTTELTTVESTALVSHRAATNAAGLCRELVVKTASKIQGKRYVQVEGWQAIANTFGCVASARNVERVEGGFRATGQVIRLSDGTVIAEAEGFVGDDEKTWASRPVFARRAMAQTRAMSRACRSAFAFVVTLMDAGLETTPAEEMTHVAEEPAMIRPQGQPAKPLTKSVKDAGGITVAHVERFEPQATDDAVGKARLAVSKAGTLDALDTLRKLVDKRLGEGVFTAAQHDELVKLMRHRAEMLIESSDTGTEFVHEAAEHEVTA